MGVAGDFLPRILEATSRSVDLRDYRGGILLPESVAREGRAAANSKRKRRNADKTSRRRRRPLRIGIDVSAWIYRAGFAFGEKLMHDDRHLTSYGRANIHQQQQQQQQQGPKKTLSTDEIEAEKKRDYCEACANYVVRRLILLKEGTNADILVVFDGRTPPIKNATVNQRKKDRHSYQALRDDQQAINGSDGGVDRGKNSNNNNNNNSSSSSSAPIGDEFNFEMDIERRVKANRRAGPGNLVPRIVDTIIEILRQKAKNVGTRDATTSRTTAQGQSTRMLSNNNYLAAWMVAPYEADSQLAYLSKQSYIDVVITEDTDLIAHGCRSVLYKCLDNSSADDDTANDVGDGNSGNKNASSSSAAAEVHIDITRGKLVEFQDLGGSRVFTSGEATKPDLTDFSPVMMAVLFVLLGCDYNGHRKLKGIGIVKACKIVRKAFLGSSSSADGGPETTDLSSERGAQQGSSEPSTPVSTQESTKSSRSCLDIVWEEAYAQCYELRGRLTEEFKRDYQKSFVEALWMYRHPIVFDPMIRTCIQSPSPVSHWKKGDGGNQSNDDDFGDYDRLGDPELIEGCREYSELSADPIRITQVVGELPPTQEECIAIAEGRSHTQWKLRKPTPIYSQPVPITRPRTSPRKKKLKSLTPRGLEGSASSFSRRKRKDPPPSGGIRRESPPSSTQSERRRSLDGDEIALVAAGGAKKDDRRPPSLAVSGKAKGRNLFPGNDENQRRRTTAEQPTIRHSPSAHSHGTHSHDSSGKTVPLSADDSRQSSSTGATKEQQWSPNLLATTTPSGEGSLTQSSSKATLSVSASGKDTIAGSQSSSKAMSQRTTQTQSSSKTTQSTTPKTPSSAKSVNLLDTSSPSESQHRSQQFSTQEEPPLISYMYPIEGNDETIFDDQFLFTQEEILRNEAMPPPRPPKRKQPSPSALYRTPSPRTRKKKS